jgi:hypothetical protein
MPLMGDWSATLCGALDERETGLAAACGLSPDSSGPEFEANLGMLLHWERAQQFADRFIGLGGPHPGGHTTLAQEAIDNARSRLAVMKEVLNQTLYAEFGLDQIDDERAHMAYGGLLSLLGDPELIVATTNYDKSAEIALAGLGHTVQMGFVPRAGRTPILQPLGMVRNQRTETVVIHLHGAVGWYERNGRIEEHYADQPYRAEQGTPVVLYPDPDKEPIGNGTVSVLWTEFRHAIAWADHILVLGHGLNDRALIRELARAGNTQIAVTYHTGWSTRPNVRASLPEAMALSCNFGPEPLFENELQLKAWMVM